MTLIPSDIDFTQNTAYLQLHQDVLINSTLWTTQPQILAAGLGFEGIIGVPGVLSSSNLDLAAAAGAGVNFDLLTLDPDVPIRNLTSASSPAGAALVGYGGLPYLSDAMPIEFSWPLLPSSVSPSDIQIILNTGERVTPDLAALHPNFDYNERHVIVVFGDFANRLAPGEEGAVYPVSIEIVDDGTPLMAVGPNGPVSLVGLTSSSSNPYVAGPTLVGAKLTENSVVGDYSPSEFRNAAPNDAIGLYGDNAEYRLRLFTSGGFSPDGVSGFLPTEFARYFRLHATDADGNEVVINQAGVDYDLGDGSLRIEGLSELGTVASVGEVAYDFYYIEDHDNYFDIIISGDAAAVARLTQVEIPTSAVTGYSDIYNPGGPGRTPVEGIIYTKAALTQFFDIDVSLDEQDSVNYAAQTLSSYYLADDLPVIFRLFETQTGDHFYTSRVRTH